MMACWKRYEPRYLPPHLELSTGKHPDHGDFRVVQSVVDHSIIVEQDGERWVTTLFDIVDSYFAWKEDGLLED